MIRTAALSFALALVPAVASAQVASSSTAVAYEAPISKLRYSFMVLSTLRYQLNNGNVTEVGVTLDDGTRIPNPTYLPTGEDLYDATTTFGAEIAYEQMQLAARFDTALYFHEPVAAENAVPRLRRDLIRRYDNVYQLEYISASYSDRDVTLTVGDYYMTLGRGLILAIRKVGDVGLDNKLRGANLKLRLGDLTLNPFGGFTNIKNYEAGTGYNYDNGNDRILGGRAEYKFGKYLKLGGHGVWMTNREELPIQVEYRGYGATVELPRPVKWLSMYGEIGRMERDSTSADFIGVDQTNSLAIYGSANIYAGPLTVLLEGKHYDNQQLIPPDLFQQGVNGNDIDSRQALNQYVAPPTAERQLLILLTNQTVSGGRIRLDYRINSKIIPFLAFGRYYDRSVGDNDPVDATAVYGGGTFRWDGGRIRGNAGYRGQFGGLDRDDLHLVLDVAQHLWADYEFEFVVNALRARQDLQDDGWREDWVEGRFAASFKAGRTWGATLAYEYYTRQPDKFRQHYPSIAGQWQFSDNGLVRALVGGERAGLKCTGGVCRFFPGFEGARMELDWRF